MTQFAIGKDGKVSIWCKDLGTDEHGRQFDCLNGGWSGFIDSEGKLHVEMSGESHEATIVWEGTCPLGNYNEAIPWIQTQLLPASKLYGEPHPEASTWLWREVRGSSAGGIRGATEMEALDRLREAYPDVGAIEWTRRVPVRQPKVELPDADEVAF